MPANAYMRRQYAIASKIQPAERALIKFYELSWMLGHRIPSVEEVTAELRKKMPSIRQTSVNYYLMRAPVRKALTELGIPFEQHTRETLTDQQQAAVLTVMNMMDTRSIAEKLDSIGVLPATYYAWLNDPMFKNFVDELTEQNKINIRPTAVTEFTKKINQGDWQAIRYWLEVTGEFTNQDVPRSEQLLRMLIEIIQKHVKDPEVIMAIAQDIKLASANRTLEVVTQQPALESYSVADDVQLEDAKKKLGI